MTGRKAWEGQSRSNGRRNERGFTLLEVALAGAVLTLGLIGFATALGGNTTAMGNARELTNAAHFLEEVRDSISAQSYENLDALNGNILYSSTEAKKARYRVHVTVSQAMTEMKAIRLVLRNNTSGSQITKLVTYKTRKKA